MMKKSRKPGKPILRIVLLCLIVTLALMYSLFRIQSRITFEDIHSDLSRELDILCDNYDRSLPVKESTAQYNNLIYQNFVHLIADVLTRTGEDSLTNDSLAGLCRDLKANNIAVIDPAGNLLYHAYPVAADFTRDIYNQLRYAAISGEVSDGFSVRLNGETNLYYGYPLGKDKIVVLIAPAEDPDGTDGEAFEWSSLLKNANPGINGTTLVQNPQDYTIIWAEDAGMIGSRVIYKAIETQLTEEPLFAAEASGKHYYAMNRYLPNAEVTLVTMISTDEVDRLVTTPVLFLSLFFFLGAGFLCAFCIIRSNEESSMTSGSLRRKMLPIVLTIAAFLLLSAFYLQTLCSLSMGMMRGETNANNIQHTVRQNEENLRKITESNDALITRTAERAAYMVTRFPEITDTKGLAELSGILNCEEIRIFDTDGLCIAGSHGRDRFSLSENPESPTYEFRRLLKGAKIYCQPAMLNENGEMRQYAGAALFDQNGDNCGLIQIGILPVQVLNAAEYYSFESAISSFATSNGTFAFSVTKDDKRFSWYPAVNLIGKNALEYDLKESNFRDNFNGFLTVNGTDCFGNCKEDTDNYLFVATPRFEIYRYRVKNVLLNTAFIVLALLILLLAAPILLSGTLRDNPDNPVPAQKESPLRYYIRSQWKDSGSGRKMAAVLRGVLIVITIAISLLYLFRDELMSEGSILKYIFDGRWDYGIHAFSITACLTLICVISIGVMLIRRLLAYLAKVLNPRGETICRLISNFIYVFSVFVCIYFCLSYFGVDTSTLLASAGIMSVVIGLGANKLIGDILGGLAIVFDGSIKVGDWIRAGEYEGVVKEIGIRSTKLVDQSNRRHIIPNSELGGIINSTVPDFKVRAGLRVAFDESADYIRQILDAEREDIRNRNPKIKDGPYVEGVIDVSETGYEICFYLYCEGNDCPLMNSVLRNEIRMLFIKYNIRRDVKASFVGQGTPQEILDYLYPAKENTDTQP